MIRITRKFEFDAGHRVLGHEGKCARLHGHRYVAEVTVEAPKLDKLGRVVDFSVMKNQVGGWIDEHWDHNMILHEEDPLASLWVKASDRVFVNEIFGGKRPYLMSESNPTAENMAKVLFWKSGALLTAEDLQIVHVRLYETPNCFADYDGKD